ncbi:WD40 repeat-like protein [Hyaloscypha bicolor E]|uniref:WD40 repeat-like protein n=1 Tax=Hyaloscypha bicolor E TaxID=1095630 RepID=A0A2J6SHR6_9HELO|nr:WD40 repeat-like protein [Hyaloscypha bicolor E]PMD50315.1 WD40 repeat-like protein [Hyaloscypha bicolor E]
MAPAQEEPRKKEDPAKSAKEEDDDPLDDLSDAFQLLSHGHRDMIATTAFNYYGDRFATGSVDGKIKVYNKNNAGNWVLCDTWGAHNAEVYQIQWLHPQLHPNLIASVGADGRFRLWVEDPTIAPNKGRRFNSHSNKPVWELRAPSRAPFLSFSMTFNTETRHTYLAVINRNAQLAVFENDQPENLENWNEMDKVNVCDKPARGEEVSFKVMFDPNLEPCYNALRLGVPRDSLAVVVASMNRASLWRTKEISHSVTLGSSTSKEFYLACRFDGHRSLVRDIAWAPGNIRGYDFVATACKDGFVRVFKVETPGKAGEEPRSKDYAKLPEKVVVPQSAAENGGRNTPSGIGAGLANARPGPSGSRAPENQGKEGEVLHVATEVSKMAANRVPWNVDFDHDGQVLGSTGDDGKLILWRREPSGIWSKSSELAMAMSVAS